MTSSPAFVGERIWCPFCKDHTQFVSIQHATKFADVSSRSIYRYIESGKIYSFRLAGTGPYRICMGCLLSRDKKADE